MRRCPPSNANSIAPSGAASPRSWNRSTRPRSPHSSPRPPPTPPEPFSAESATEALAEFTTGALGAKGLDVAFIVLRISFLHDLRNEYGASVRSAKGKVIWRLSFGLDVGQRGLIRLQHA